MHTVAGHTFKRLTPGEWCVGDDCRGMQSLVELMSAADTALVGDQGIAHDGRGLSDAERESMKDAKVQYNANMAKIMGF